MSSRSVKPHQNAQPTSVSVPEPNTSISAHDILSQGVGTMTVAGPHIGGASDIFTPAALEFLAELHHEFYARRRELLAAREIRRAIIENGGMPNFKEDTTDIRTAQWSVVGSAGAPGLERRTVEFTTPVTPRDAATALNSDADVWLADLEDGLAPTWTNVVRAHVVLRRAARGDFAFQSRSGATFHVRNPNPPTMMVRPRGWHLPEAHLCWTDGRGREHQSAAALVDFGLFFFHNARALQDRGFGPYLYLPKLESAREAKLWNDVFEFAQQRLGFATGTIRASVLIESITAAYQMEEILYELRDHAVGMAAGRWDYVASLVRTLGAFPEFLLPDRVELSANMPFMSAFSSLLIDTCHRRGAHALGGMSTDVFEHEGEKSGEVPATSAKEIYEAEQRAIARVREDKVGEARLGFDGTWVAHPSLIATAAQAFREVLGQEPHQLGVHTRRQVVASDLLPAQVGAVAPTEEAVRAQIQASLHYFNAWLFGRGQAQVGRRVEDSSTVELARTLLWQWVAHGIKLSDGRTLNHRLFKRIVAEELAVIPRDNLDHFDEAEEMLLDTVLSERRPEYFTVGAYSKFLDHSFLKPAALRAQVWGGQTFLSTRAA